MGISTFASILVLYLCVAKIIPYEARTVKAQSTQEIIKSWIAKQNSGAVSVAVVTPEDTEYFFAGQVTNNDKTLPDKETMFEIGSITKTFTGLLLADQILAGNVFLNDTLATMLTDWPGRFSSQAGNVTLLELATHSSGFPRLPANIQPPNPHNPYANYTVEKLYAWLDVIELSNRGTYLYSNAGVGTLGHALTVRAGKKYEDFLKQRILTPLQLRDTTITLSSDQRSRLIPGHNFAGQIVPFWDQDVLAPAGALHSSISEFARFLEFATGLSQEPTKLHEVFDFATQSRGVTDSGTIGICWLRTLLPQDKLLVWHNGASAGFNSYVGWLPEQQVGVAVLASMTTHDPNSTDNLALDILKEMTN